MCLCWTLSGWWADAQNGRRRIGLDADGGAYTLMFSHVRVMRSATSQKLSRPTDFGLDVWWTGAYNVPYLRTVAPEWHWKCGGGAPVGREFFLVVPLHLFGSISIIRLCRAGEGFRDGQYTVWPVSCLLFFYSRCPRAQPFVKVGGGHVLPSVRAL